MLVGTLVTIPPIAPFVGRPYYVAPVGLRQEMAINERKLVIIRRRNEWGMCRVEDEGGGYQFDVPERNLVTR